MTLPTANKRINGVKSASAFTLIELILVMALLSIVLSTAGPSLARFFRGRALDSEAHRFLALTKYGQSRAVAEGAPMVLWIDEEQGFFGLKSETSYLEEDRKALEFELNEDVAVIVDLPVARSLFNDRNANVTALVAGRLPVIRFTPDGFIGENSPPRVLFQEIHEGDSGEVWISQSRNRLYYEVQTNLLLRARR